MELNPIKYFTFRRISNLLKVFYSYYFSSLIRKPIIQGMPLVLSVEPTNLCNLSCPECPSGSGSLTRPLGMMRFDKFREIVEQVKEEVFYLQFFFQGEPFLNPELFLMLKYSRQNNIYTCVNTNGTILNENTVERIIADPPDKLIFSIDGLDQQTYEQYRKGGSFEKAVNGLKLLSGKKKFSGKKLPLIEFQFIIMKHNENQAGKVRAFARDLGADKLVCKSMQVYSAESAKNFIPSESLYSRYTIVDDKVEIKGKMKNKCLSLWSTAVITWDGRMVPCCFDKNADYQYGILDGKTLKELWRSDVFNSFRRNVLLNRRSVDICNNCSNGIKTELIKEVF